MKGLTIIIDQLGLFSWPIIRWKDRTQTNKLADHLLMK